MSASKATTTVSGPPCDTVVTMPLSWFDSAFFVAYGSTIPQILNRLHADISAVEAQFGEDSCLGRMALNSFRERLGVAAEWSERLQAAVKEADNA